MDEFEELLERYWQLAHEEGRLQKSNGDEANEVLHKLRAAWNIRAPQWQPIETSPKDGTICLAYSTKYANNYWITNKFNGMTHWMPLPDAPK